MHSANRRHWNNAADGWERLRDEDDLWQRCPREPDLGFQGDALGLVRQVSGEPKGKDVCVIGSGDNYAAFALCGLGAKVTSIDISERQLDVASKRAQQLGLSIEFIGADAASLDSVEAASFDLVCSSNGFFVWIAELKSVFGEVFRILRPGGHYVFYDIHPFQRPWKEQVYPIEVEKPYWETGPICDEKNGTFTWNWTLADVLNPLVGTGFSLRRILESPAEDSRHWQDSSYQPGTDESLLDWKKNPRTALPVWLTVAVQKPV